MTFVHFEICHQMASLRKLYYVTLPYVLKVKLFTVFISLKR